LPVAERDPIHLYGLVSPKMVKWANGELEDPEALRPTEVERIDLPSTNGAPYEESISNPGVSGIPGDQEKTGLELGHS
jgi:hypothetical protein